MRGNEAQVLVLIEDKAAKTGEGIEFDYKNHRGEDHSYWVSPVSFGWGCKVNGVSVEGLTMVADVKLRDGKAHPSSSYYKRAHGVTVSPVRRTFEVAKIQNVRLPKDIH